MSDPQDHSPSGSDPRGRSGFDPLGANEPEAGEPEGGGEAQRFWGEYARRTRPGGQRTAGAEETDDAQNGHGIAASHSHECLEWCPICRAADLLRASASPELREQVQGLQRDALLTLRALLDAYIERSEGPRGGRDSAVEDIPID